MDIQNHYYGHAALLASAAGQQRVRHLPGLLQHGWTLTSPVSAMFGDFPKVGLPGSRRKLLVWSHRSRSWDPAADRHETTPIGAPFLYLLRLAPDGTDEPAKRPLIAPQHATFLKRATSSTMSLPDYYRDRYGPSTVCLHVNDLVDVEAVSAWRAAGHDVVSAGDRFDPLFLARQLGGLRAASELITNRLSTVVFYALAAGVPIRIDGEQTLLEGESDTVLDGITQRWPELHDPTTPLEQARAIALDELGADHVLPPADLAETLGFHSFGATAAAGFDYWATSSLRKAAMVLGVTRRTEFSDHARSVGAANTGPAASAFLRHPFSHLPSRLPSLPAFERGARWLRPEDVRR